MLFRSAFKRMPFLREIELRGHLCLSENSFQIILEAISACPALFALILDFSTDNFTQQAMCTLSQFRKDFNRLRSFGFKLRRVPKVDPEALSGFFTFLKNLDEIKELTLDFCISALDNSTLAHVAKTLPYLRNLRSLTLDFTFFPFRSAERLKDVLIAIKSMPKLTMLDLRNWHEHLKSSDIEFQLLQNPKLQFVLNPVR